MAEVDIYIYIIYILCDISLVVDDRVSSLDIDAIDLL